LAIIERIEKRDIVEATILLIAYSGLNHTVQMQALSNSVSTHFVELAL